MLVFVDESGDAGLKIGSGSSETFTVVAVIFKDHSQALQCDKKIEQLKSCWKLPCKFEFRFSKTAPILRERFFREVVSFEFIYFGFILNKKNVKSEGFKDKKTLYKYPVRLMMSNAREHLEKATIIFDSCGGREFGRELHKYLNRVMKDRNGKSPIKKIKSENSKNNNLLQLADMVCGAVARSVRLDKNDRLTYRQLIRSKEVRVQLWP